jgi:hypothetical protein
MEVVDPHSHPSDPIDSTDGLRRSPSSSSGQRYEAEHSQKRTT